MRCCLFCVMILCTASARADLVTTDYIVNGDFTDPVDLAGWTPVSTTTGNWVLAPLGAPLGGGRHAVTSNQPSSFQRLFQQFTLSSTITFATLTWRDAFDSGGVNWSDGAHEYRVVLRDTSGAELFEVFSSNSLLPTDHTEGPTNRGSIGNMTAFAIANLGSTIRLSFEAIDSGTYIEAHLDNVVFSSTFDTSSVPEPSSFLLVALSAAGAIGVRWRRQSAKAAA